MVSAGGTLQHINAHVSALRERFSHAPISIRTIDLAALTFEEQLHIARNTDVLVGVHGAGLTHSLFLKPGAAVVEIMPHDVQHKGFRNLAGMRGMGYFGVRGGYLEDEGVKGGSGVVGQDWHHARVSVGWDVLGRAVEAALWSVGNVGLRNVEVG